MVSSNSPQNNEIKFKDVCLAPKGTLYTGAPLYHCTDWRILVWLSYTTYWRLWQKYFCWFFGRFEDTQKNILKLTDLQLAQKKRQLFWKSTFQHSVQFLFSIFVNAQEFGKNPRNCRKKMQRFVIKRELRNGFNFSTIFLNKTWQQRPDFYNN